MLLLIILYIVGSVGLFYAVHLYFNFVSFSGKGLLTFFPTIICFILPLLSFFFAWLNTHHRNIQSKWRIKYYYSIIVLLLSVVSLATHIFDLIFTFKWNFYKGVLPLFPFDVLGMFSFFFILSLVLFINALRHRSQSIEEKTRGDFLKVSTAIIFFVFVGVASYFYGGSICLFFLIKFPPNYNVIFIIGVFFALIALTVEVLLYALYIHQPNGLKRQYQKLGLIIGFIYYVVVLIWIIVGTVVSPSFITDYLSNIFPLIKITVNNLPIGLIVIAVFASLPLIYSLIKYIRDR